MIPNRTTFTAQDSLEHLWKGLNLPPEALTSLHLTGTELYTPSSFKIADLAQSSIGLSTLLAAQIYALRRSLPKVPTVRIHRLHAVLEFKSERLCRLSTGPVPETWGPLGGLHKSADGYIRMHDSFPNHRAAAIALLGCTPDATTRADIAAKVRLWRSVDLESAAGPAGAVIAALRSPAEWDSSPQAAAIPDFPIRLRRIGDAPVGLPGPLSTVADPDKCLRGLRVVELSRVIAAPVSGRTLAAHGADVLWVTGPKLPDLPGLDRDLARGKRTVQIDLGSEEGAAELGALLDDAHVFIQGYRPGSLAARGFSPAQLVERFAQRNGGKGRGIICANLSAYGPDGPWATRRGFDSLVQTCSGMNVSEAEHFGAGEPARAMPCQALDHAAGYFLAAGVMAALYRQATVGGSWEVDVSLAGVMKYLRSLGQYPGRSGFEIDTTDHKSVDDVPEEFLETRDSAFGEMTALSHAGVIEGMEVGWDIMPKPLGSDEKRWLSASEVGI